MSYNLNFKIEILTPLFMSGADQHAPPYDIELRPPAIEGALRFWYRAMMGGVLGEQHLSKLNQLEGNLFGLRQSVKSSQVRIRVINRPPPNVYRSFDYGNLRYMGFGLNEQKEAGIQARKCIPEGNTFSVELTLNTTDDAKLLIGCMWLLANFGGLGSRGRRGFGSIKIAEAKISGIKDISDDIQTILNKLFPNSAALATSEQVKSYLIKSVKTIREIFIKKAALPGDYSPIFNTLPSFTIIAKPHFTIKLVTNNTFDSWQKVLNYAQKEYRAHREGPNAHEHLTDKGFKYRITRDYAKVKGLEGNNPALTLPVFGLPVSYKFSNLKGKRMTVTSEKYDRRASPLIFRVLKTGENKYYLLVVKARAQFLPNNNLIIKERDRTDRSATLATDSWAKVDEFLNSISDVKLEL